MALSTWLLFVSVAFIATFSPGPAVLLAVSNSLRFGLRTMFYSTLGNELGLLVIASITILGLGAVLSTSTTLFFILKMIGAGYLIYLGIRQWRSTKAFFLQEADQSHQQVQRDGVSFTQGFLVATTNPKAILFFTALLPQFISLDKPLILQFSILIATFSFCSTCALIGYGFLAYRSKKWFSIEKRTSLFNRIFGGVFIALGIGLLQLNHKN